MQAQIQNIFDPFFKEYSSQSHRISGLSNTSISLLAASALKNTQKSILYILDDTINSRFVEYEIAFFLSFLNFREKVEVLKLPSKNSFERPKFFENLLFNKNQKIILINNSSLLENTISKLKINKEVFELKTGEIFKRQELTQKLVSFGFSNQDEVYEKTDFSVRGEILDLWPADLETPVRIIFDDNEIEAIYEFDILTQRRSKKIESLIIRNFSDDSDTKIIDYFSREDFLLIYNQNYTNNTKHLLQDFESIQLESFVYEKDRIFNMQIQPTYNLKGMQNLLYKQLEELKNENFQINIVLYKNHEIDSLRNLISEKLKNLKIDFYSGILREGFISRKNKVAILTERDIFDRDYLEAESDQKIENFDVFKDNFFDYKIGDYVVHNNFGIGKFLGFNKVQTLDRTSEYITLEYQNNDKLYVPIYDFNLVHKYSNEEAEYKPILDTLDSVTWEKTRRKIEEKIFELANEIIAIQAKRKTIKGINFEANPAYEEEFRATFPFDETIDQKNAIIDVLEDMEGETPMERLVCGDVGYGKTEVAIRAAFRACVNSKQVALVAPTTILARQHFSSFTKRFANSPIKIVMLSRFCSGKELKENKKLIQDGKADIVISTHSVLRSNIKFKNLGLVIIDEEHRFGVKDKEKLKRLEENIDLLFLSATPIPRTLSMALNGVKDISLIETPPPNRKEISTQIAQYDKIIVKEAINFELARGGQVFYIYNRIEDIEQKKIEIQKLAPNAKIAVAHANLSNSDLDEIMTNFVNRDYDILLATTIVESGLDIPSVNMMIIDGAERMGLAQLYQLRGRVGRGYEKAFCYMLYPNDINLNSNAVKRLEAIQNFQGFGAGFKLAMRDLEIRGAGNILGKKQHGYIKEVGFELYMDMLNRALNKANSGSHDDINAEINLNINAYIPDQYISNPAIRLYFYKKLLNITDYSEIEEIENEFLDRFGKLPPVLKNFIELSEIRIFAKKLNILAINEIKNKIKIDFANNQNIDVNKILDLAQTYKNFIRFSSNNFNTIDLCNLPDNKSEKINLLKKILQGFF